MPYEVRPFPLGYSDGARLSRKPATVAAPVVQSKTRVATLDVQKVVLSSPDGLDAVAELQRKFDPEKDRLDSQQQEIQKLRGQPGNEARVAALEQIYRRGMGDARQKFDLERERVYKEIAGKVTGLAGEYAKRERFAFVVDISDLKAPLVWHTGETEITDITDELIELLKEP
jgi:Skp family chaperone for outer membrane proteins